MIPWLTQHFAPNRIAVYITALVALATALSPAFVEYDLATLGAVATAVAVYGTIVLRWLTGWQSYEKFLMTADLERLRFNAETAQMDKLAEARGSVDAKPKSRIATPRR